MLVGDGDWDLGGMLTLVEHIMLRFVSVRLGDYVCYGSRIKHVIHTERTVRSQKKRERSPHPFRDAALRSDWPDRRISHLPVTS